jgi:membrane-bound metal-dependent hydrolase YbcI (DUF457 family)
MFLGHFALAFAAKRSARNVSRPVLFAAAQLADLLWPLFLIAGIERVRIDPGNTAFTPLDFVSYPYSHSLLLLGLWGFLLGALYWLRTRDSRALVVLFLLAVSHWFLDVLTHRTDMPLYPGGPKLGLGLWNSISATLAIEMALYAAGLWLYVRATRPRDAIGPWAFATLSIFLVLAYLGAFAGGPPPSVIALEGSALAGGILIVLWSAWVDSHRESRSSPSNTRSIS